MDGRERPSSQKVRSPCATAWLSAAMEAPVMPVQRSYILSLWRGASFMAVTSVSRPSSPMGSSAIEDGNKTH